jgi:hypothetical protein
MYLFALVAGLGRLMALGRLVIEARDVMGVRVDEIFPCVVNVFPIR